MIDLREYQVSAIQRLRDGIRKGHSSQLLQLAAGGGKTSIAAEITKSAVSKGKRVMFIVDTLELVDQAVQTFGRAGLESEIGVMQGDHWLTDSSRMVQVATRQTLSHRWEDMNPKPDVIFHDECHVWSNISAEICNWAKAGKVPFIGLSATPWRKGLGEHFSDLVIGATPEQLTEQGYLKPSICYSVFNPDLKGVKTKSDGDWQEEALSAVMQGEQLMGDIVQTWIKQGYGRKTIAFCCNVAHSRALQQMFLNAGIKAVEVNGYQKDDERNECFHQYENGDAQIMCSVAVVSKGYDYPPTSCLILARPTKSMMMHYQQLGRGLRVGGFPECIILDHAGNLLRNGMPLDPLPERLDQRESGLNPDRKQPDPKVKEPKPCVSCQALINGRHCPFCFAEQPLPKVNVESAAGELVQINGAKREKKWTPEEKADIYAQLLTIGRETGKKDGWAWFKVKEFCGSAPRDTKQITGVTPTPEIRSWVKSQNIRWAKRKQA